MVVNSDSLTVGTSGQSERSTGYPVPRVPRASLFYLLALFGVLGWCCYLSTIFSPMFPNPNNYYYTSVSNHAWNWVTNNGLLVYKLYLDVLVYYLALGLLAVFALCAHFSSNLQRMLHHRVLCVDFFFFFFFFFFFLVIILHFYLRHLSLLHFFLLFCFR